MQYNNYHSEYIAKGRSDFELSNQKSYFLVKNCKI